MAGHTLASRQRNTQGLPQAPKSPADGRARGAGQDRRRRHSAPWGRRPDPTAAHRRRRAAARSGAGWLAGSLRGPPSRPPWPHPVPPPPPCSPSLCLAAPPRPYPSTRLARRRSTAHRAREAVPEGHAVARASAAGRRPPAPRRSEPRRASKRPRVVLGREGVRSRARYWFCGISAGDLDLDLPPPLGGEALQRPAVLGQRQMQPVQIGQMPGDVPPASRARSAIGGSGSAAWRFLRHEPRLVATKAGLAAAPWAGGQQRRQAVFGQVGGGPPGAQPRQILGQPCPHPAACAAGRSSFPWKLANVSASACSLDPANGPRRAAPAAGATARPARSHRPLPGQTPHLPGPKHGKRRGYPPPTGQGCRCPPPPPGGSDEWRDRAGRRDPPAPATG